MTRPAARPGAPGAETPPDAGAHGGLSDLAGVALVSLVMVIPYTLRIRLAGWASRVVMSRVTGIRPRIRQGLNHLFPDLPEPEVARIVAAVTDNMGRTAVEILSGQEFCNRTAATPIEGPGIAALDAARISGRPVLLLTAHFGNAAAIGSAFNAHGMPFATYFSPFRGPAFNRRYVAAVEAITSPLFPAGREGVAMMVRHLRAGGIMSISFDLDREHGEILDFLGKPARTVLSMAEMALRYDALLLPVHGIRQPDGLSFRVHVDKPIEHDEPRAMMQAANDCLGRMVTRHKDQWLWWHKRWKRGFPVDSAAAADANRPASAAGD